MYTIRKMFKFEGSHILTSSYSKECQRIHGHSYKVEVFITTDTLDKDGMVIDFKLLKEIVNPLIQRFDHQCLYQEGGFLEEIPNVGMIPFPTNPTAENMCKYFYDQLYIQFCLKGYSVKLKIRIHETDTGWAEYYE